MSPAERYYAQIEKQTLGAVFRCEKFCQYFNGGEVALEIDHKLLIVVLKKVLGDTPLHFFHILFFHLVVREYLVIMDY